MQPTQLLEWYVEAGVDETIGDTPVNRLTAAAITPSPPTPTPISAAPPFAPAASARMVPPSEAAAEARALADRCTTLAELEAAVQAFDGCGLKKTAMKTVFSDGNPAARVMVIGEAPGAQEDMQGIPFCGPSGALLDRMFAAIGLSRANPDPLHSLYISNTVFWRPPGNRTPNAIELAICEPFVEKHIALINPKLLVLAGGVAMSAVLKRDQPLSRLRGKFYEYSNPYLEQPLTVAVTFHPSYLLRSPSQKRLAWADLLQIQSVAL